MSKEQEEQEKSQDFAPAYQFSEEEVLGLLNGFRRSNPEASDQQLEDFLMFAAEAYTVVTCLQGLQRGHLNITEHEDGYYQFGLNEEGLAYINEVTKQFEDALLKESTPEE